MGFSIKHLLLAVVYVAIGLAALANLSSAWLQLLLRLSIFVTLIFAAYSTWINSDESRAFYFGLTLWTILYLLTHVTFPRAGFQFGTGYLLDGLRQLTATTTPDLQIEQFVETGHLFLSLVFGLIGGCVTVYFYRKRQRMLSEKR
jgi:hypothetical protein